MSRRPTRSWRWLHDAYCASGRLSTAGHNLSDVFVSHFPFTPSRPRPLSGRIEGRAAGVLACMQRPSIRRQRKAATCMLGLWGAVRCQLTDRAREVGCGPVRIRPRRAGERSLWHAATSSWRRTARGGGWRGAVEKFPGMDDGALLVSGRPCATEAIELVPETGPPPSSSMPWSIQGQRACIRKSGRRWLRVRGPGHPL